MGDALAGPYFLAAGLLALSGLGKLRRPAAAARALGGAGLPDRWPLVRALGAAEMAVGGVALAWPRPIPASFLAVLYVAFGAFVAYLLRAGAPARSCGCAGGRDVPPSLSHVVLNVIAAAAAVTVALDPQPNVVSFALDTPLNGLPFLGLLLAAGYLAIQVTTLLPEVRRLVKASFRIGHDHGPHARSTVRPALLQIAKGPS